MFPFSYILKTFRKCCGITQTDLCNKIPCSQSLISKIEREEVNPSLFFVDRCADIFGVQTSFMLDLRDEIRIDTLQNKIKKELCIKENE